MRPLQKRGILRHDMMGRHKASVAALSLLPAMLQLFELRVQVAGKTPRELGGLSPHDACCMASRATPWLMCLELKQEYIASACP